MKSLSYLINRLVLRRSFLTASAPKYGLSFRFKTQDAIGRSIYKRGTYEADITEFLMSHLSLTSHDIVLDIGSNLGWYAMILAKHFSTQIYAFEPDTLNSTLLRHNIRLNQLKNVFCIEKAVSDHSGSEYLYQYTPSNLGRHSLLPLSTNTSGKEKVKLITLNDFLKVYEVNADSVKLIKIDIEGYEYVALKAGTKLLGKVPLIISEYSPTLMQTHGIDTQQYWDLLKSHGYAPYELKEDRLHLMRPQTMDASSYPATINIFWKLRSA